MQEETAPMARMEASRSHTLPPLRRSKTSGSSKGSTHSWPKYSVTGKGGDQETDRWVRRRGEIQATTVVYVQGLLWLGVWCTCDGVECGGGGLAQAMVRHHIPIVPQPVLVLLLVVIVVILPARTTCTHAQGQRQTGSQ
jgi:hypothetical protein